MHILVVDDDVEYRNVLREAIQLDGHSVTTAADGAEAFERLQQRPVGLVISDINMPKCSGTQLHELVRTDNRLKYIPFIYITGFTILRVATPLERTDLDFIVSKVPFDRLLQLISDISARYAAMPGNRLSVGLA